MGVAPTLAHCPPAGSNGGMVLPAVRLPTLGVSVDSTGCDLDDLVYCAAVQVRAGGDEAWAPLVDRAVASGWVGLEALAGHGGSVADVTRDNAAGYGHSVADTVVAVRTWDRIPNAQLTFPLADCGFGPGRSRFQERLADGSLRFEILDVAFLLRQGDVSPPASPELAGLLGTAPGERVPLAAVNAAVRAQR